MELGKLGRTLIVCVLATGWLGCAKDKKEEPGVDYSQSFSQPLNKFVPEGREMEEASVSRDARMKMLECETPNTLQRISGESMNINYRVLAREREALDSHFAVRDESKGYSTHTNGSIFKRTYTLNALSIDAASALSSGPLSYRDSCTANGCDLKQREYLQGSALYMIQVDANLRKIYHDTDMKAKKVCRFSSTDRDAKQTVTQGTYSLSGTSYPALQFKSSEKGELYCEVDRLADGGATSIYVGKAVRESVKIVIADVLPQVGSEIGGYGTYDACDRTVVFSAKYVESEGRTFSGSAHEILSMSLDATVLSVEHFNKARKNRADMVQKLRGVVIMARSEHADAEFAVAEARVKSTEARSKATLAEDEAIAAEAKANSYEATDADKTHAYLKRAEATAAKEHATRMEAVLDSKIELAGIAQRRLLKAEADLEEAERELREAQN